MSGEVAEFDAELEARIAEDEAVRRLPTARMRMHRFAEVETLAKRLFCGVEYVTNYDGVPEPTTIGVGRAFALAEEFLQERDRRKAALS